MDDISMENSTDHLNHWTLSETAYVFLYSIVCGKIKQKKAYRGMVINQKQI